MLADFFFFPDLGYLNHKVSAHLEPSSRIITGVVSLIPCNCRQLNRRYLMKKRSTKQPCARKHQAEAPLQQTVLTSLPLHLFLPVLNNLHL